MKYITTLEAAARHRVTTRRIMALAKQGRVPGAKKFSGVWMIPDPFTVLPPPQRKRGMDKIRL